MRSRISSGSSRRRLQCESSVVGIAVVCFRRRRASSGGTQLEIMICLCSFFIDQPLATNSVASQSSSSGWEGSRAANAEIARGATDPAAEMIMPDPVHHHARGQRI